MVSVTEVYDSLLTLVRKDKRGLSLSPEEYNKIIESVNQQIYKLAYAEFEATKTVIDRLDAFKVVGETIALTGGIGDLPADYKHLVGNPYYDHDTSGTRQIDLVTSSEHRAREMDYMTKGSLLYPTAFLKEGVSSDKAIAVTPNTITSIYIDYLRELTVPYLDYYVDDTTLQITYLEEDPAAQSIPSGVTLADGTAGPVANYVSLTKNFEWTEADRPQIINLCLEAAGVQLPDQVLLEVSNKNEPKYERQ